MEITPENKQLIKVLNALIGGRVKVGLEKFPVAIVHEYNLTSEIIGVNEGMEILNVLREKEYITLMTEAEHQEYQKEFDKAMNWLFRYLRKRRGVPKKKIEKMVKDMLYKFGFDSETENFKNTDRLENLDAWEQKVSNTVYEKQIKSPEVDKYRITKNLFLLREQLRRGKDFYNMTKEFLTYDSEKYDLYIGEEYVNIKPREDIPTGHYILKYIFDNNKRAIHSLDEMRDNNVIPLHYQMETLKQYQDSARGITRKVKNKTNNKYSDFLKITKETVKIRDKYTL
jgi:hypothetical protein